MLSQKCIYRETILFQIVLFRKPADINFRLLLCHFIRKTLVRQHAFIPNDSCHFDIPVFCRVFKRVLASTITAFKHTHDRITINGRPAGRAVKGKLFFIFTGNESPPVKQLHQFVEGPPLAFRKKLCVHRHRRQDSYTLQTEITFFRKFQFSVLVLHVGMLRSVS